MTVTTATAVHGVFEWAGIFVGARLYLRNARMTLNELGTTRNYAVILGCIIGAAVGNKAVHWIYHADQWNLLRAQPWLILQGQSIVGALLGGLIGVEIAKRLVGERQSTGDRFVTPILVGLIIGRVGCLLAGLQDDTYGNPTTLPWGIDMGDGIRRHPTALYDMVFAAALLFVFHRWGEPLKREPGLRFKLMLAAYLAWRLLIDGLKPVPHDYGAGLGGIQLVAAVALILYLPLVWRQSARLRP
jgi:prolipoprotein diacylglyceryltransferase